MNQENLKYQIAVSLINGIGCVNAKKLVAYVGSPEGIFKESKAKLMKIPGVGNYLANEISGFKNFDRAEKEIEHCKKEGIKIFFYLDREYPDRLKNIEDSPIVLYLNGDVNFNHNKILSIVGTRSSTFEGRDNCEKLIADLKDAGHNPIIVSGLAYGIDITAHKAALKNDLKTIAVLGHGLDTIYPASHKYFADKIIKQGGLVTEFMNKSRIDKQNFVRRNRIIAAISDATIVVESAERGGALITADIANSYNKDVFAFPGRISDKYSVGCNKLIKTNKAALIENYRDLEYILGWQMTNLKSNSVQPALFNSLTDEEMVICKILKETKELSIDSICIQSNMPMSKISSILLNLEFAGIVKCLPGKIYVLHNVIGLSI